jgi:hypothetical protein
MRSFKASAPPNSAEEKGGGAPGTSQFCRLICRWTDSRPLGAEPDQDIAQPGAGRVASFSDESPLGQRGDHRGPIAWQRALERFRRPRHPCRGECVDTWRIIVPRPNRSSAAVALAALRAGTR